MNRASVFLTLCVCATALGVSAMWTGAGPLNPPAGAVTPTGATLGELGADLATLSGSPLFESSSAQGTSALYNAATSAPDIPPDGQSVFMTSLIINGAPVDGDEITPDDLQAFQLFGFAQGATVPFEKSSGLPTGRRTYEPIVIRKRIDKATPLIAKAMTNNESIECAFRFYRPDPRNAGVTEQYFTVELLNARVAAWRPVVVRDQMGDPAPTEEVSIVFQTIRWTYEPTGATHEDTWREQQ